MAKIGERASLKIIREKSFGLYLDGGDLGEVLLPHREVPKDNVIGGFLDVFLYTDSEDRPVATLKMPKAMPGGFAKLTCVAVTGIGAFLDWGLAKELLVPFGEQNARMEQGKSYLVHVHLDEVSGRIVASARLERYLDRTPHDFRKGDEVELIIYGKTDLGYKAIVGGAHSGLLFGERFSRSCGTARKSKATSPRSGRTGKSISPCTPGPGKGRRLEEQILAELGARGGYWAIGDHSRRRRSMMSWA